MPFIIQRVPRGLADVLSIFGGVSPRELEDRVRGTIELLQFYGLSQRAVLTANNAAAAEAAVVEPTLPNQWMVLFSASAVVQKTATMTALSASVQMARGGGTFNAVAAGQLGPFGATETGPVRVIFTPSVPIPLPPGTRIVAVPDIIGTDATANVTCVCEIGVLG